MSNEIKGFKKLFPRKHIPNILSSVLQAGRTLQKKRKGELENPITTRLCAKLVHFPIFRDGPLDIRPQTEIVSTDPDTPVVVGRIDILVSCGLGYQVYFAIEAKRLRVRSSDGRRVDTLNDKYVKDGMMRFVTGQYAPFMESGAMLGYVFDGGTEKARSGLDKYIRGKAEKLRLRPPKRLIRSKILAGKPVDETRHDLTGRSFIIYHILLAINPECDIL